MQNYYGFDRRKYIEAKPFILTPVKLIFKALAQKNMATYDLALSGRYQN
jgi:hypothetical protein